MRVCIPIDFQPHGGGHYFLQALSVYLTGCGWMVTDRLDVRCDVLFTNHWMVSRTQILRAIRYNPRLRIVQRIDGAAQDYGRHDDADHRQRQVNLLTDLTIFQSQYCRYSTREKFAVIVHDGPVIHNPVDIERFRPEGNRLSFPESTRVACVSWSTNPHKGTASIFAVAKYNPRVGFILCGRFPNAPDLPNLHALGVLGRDELATALRSCHVLLTFSQNEACPNHVLEALASGLPVLYDDSGAMSEVIGNCGVPVTVESFTIRLEQVMGRWAELSMASRQRALDRFHPDHIFSRYLVAMEAALQRPTAVALRRRLWLAWIEPVCWYSRRLAKTLQHRLRPAVTTAGLHWPEKGP